MKKPEFLNGYRIGADRLALAFVGVMLLPNLVSWILCGALAGQLPPYRNPYARNGVNIAAAVFLGLSLIPLVGVVRRERKKFSLFSACGTVTFLAVMLYYISWIFYFCDYGNVAVLLFLAFCPAAAFLCFEGERRNFFAMAPTALFAVLHIAATVMSVV